VSAISLLEIALLTGERGRLKQKQDELLHLVERNPVFAIYPLSFEVASEIVALGSSLRDPGDRTIVATARVHRLRLLTSDQRIINSKLIQTIE
jgi:PIN domain nuclease of toxin-antitoxin system